MVEKQIEFTECVAKLLNFAISRGYGLTFGDAWDPDHDGGHMKNSVHYQRLAIDLNLFLRDPITNEWTWVTNGRDPAWVALGLFWEDVSDLARWGGRFKQGDSNHFSFEHDGRA